MKTYTLALLFASLLLPAARGATVSFTFAPVGNSYLAFLPGDSPLIGREITSTKIFLEVSSSAGSDAAAFYTDIAFPILPFAGNESGLVLTGDELGWSGAGTFDYFEETDRFNGEFFSTRFGAETPGQDFQGKILDGSRIEFTYVPEPNTLALVGIGVCAFVAVRRFVI